MAWLTRSSHLTILALALTLSLAINVSAQVPARLRSNSLSNRLPSKWESGLALTGGRPKRTASGATRGEICVPKDRLPIALVPASGIGSTAAEYPTVFWYQPQTSASVAEFVLFDANQQEIYSTKYSLAHSAEGVTAASGIMSIPLPAFANFSPLEIDQEYQWKLSLICDPMDRSADLVIEGKIQRVVQDSSLELRLQQATSQERLALYAENRLWYEALGTLVDLRRTLPEDAELASAWDKLLESVNLPTNYIEPGFKVPANITTSKQ